MCILVAPLAGLEPATYGLTVRRSTDWTKEESRKYCSMECFKHYIKNEAHDKCDSLYCQENFKFFIENCLYFAQLIMVWEGDIGL